MDTNKCISKGSYAKLFGVNRSHFKWFYINLCPSKHRSRHLICSVICNIGRDIGEYRVFGNGGTNLHKNDTWDIFSTI